MKRKIFLGLLLVLIIIQFIRPAKNNGISGGEASIANTLAVPDDVMTIFKTACYNCHSNSTEYPWYVNIEPVGWWMGNHIKNARKRLNFDEFKNLPPDKMKRKLNGIAEDIEEDKMPLKSYRLMHSDAKLSDEQKQKVIAWAKEAQSKL